MSTYLLPILLLELSTRVYRRMEKNNNLTHCSYFKKPLKCAPFTYG